MPDSGSADHEKGAKTPHLFHVTGESHREQLILDAPPSAEQK